MPPGTFASTSTCGRRAIEALDLDGYDLVISSHHSVAHGVLTGPDQLHLCYTHSPMRYAWDQRRLYAREAGVDRGLKGWWVERTMHKARLWDTAAGARPDAFAANSAFVGRRIEKFYRRPSTVVHPPVDVGLMPFKSIKQGAYLTAGRIVNYKRFDLVVEAFRQMPDRQLVVAGSGADLTALRKDPPANVRFTGWLPDVELRTLMADAPAFLFAGVEDFGIMPIEAQACGTPVIALNQGGLKETLVGLDQPGQPTAILFEEQSVAALIAAVETFERHRTDLDPHACVANAARFAPTRFRQAFRRFAASAEQGSADAAAKQPEPAAQVKETVRQSAPAL